MPLMHQFHQTPMRLDGRPQVFPDCGYYLGRHRAGPSNSKEAILVGARSVSERRVPQATLGTGTRVVLPGGNTKRVDLARNYSEVPIQRADNAPVPHIRELWR